VIGALLTTLLTALVTVVADRLAAGQRKSSERGDYWARALLRLAWILPPALLVSASLEPLAPSWWRTGWHLLLDLTETAEWDQTTRFTLALGLPVLFYVVVLGIGLLERPGGRASGRWLAGSIGYDSSRAWVFAFALPLLLVTVITVFRLNHGALGYPAAVWATLLTASCCLFAIAFCSRRTTASVVEQVTALACAAPPRRPWPEALRARGIEVERLTGWPASGSLREVRGQEAIAFAEGLKRLGARSVAPELIEGVSSLLSIRAEPNPGDTTRVVFAPEDCGQVEVIALAAHRVRQRHQAVTLVITPTGALPLAAELNAWLPSGGEAVALDRRGQPPAQAKIWVVDAEVLSDHLLPQLKDPQRMRKIGLLIWWNLDHYSGVLAANLWAISRRLDRLVVAGGRLETRVIAFVRSAETADARLAAFVGKLLPHPFPATSEVHVERRSPCAVEVYQLDSHQDHFARGESLSVPEKLRSLPMIAAKVSAETEWGTHLTLPPQIDVSEARAFLQLGSGPGPLAERLIPRPSEAEAAIRPLEIKNCLALAETISQTGRAQTSSPVAYIGLTLPEDPYARHLLSRLRDERSLVGTANRSRRLVCTEAHPTLLRRHLLLALNERMDTRQGLLKTFLWQEDQIRQTLDEIAGDRQLHREEVRYLDPRGRLVIDHAYTSSRPPDGEPRPLDTVGVRLIAVREPAAGADTESGVRMQIDPERLTLQAYPERIFHHEGQRFRIRTWSSPAEVLARGWLACEREERLGSTYRMRLSSVFDLKPLKAAVGIGKKSRLLAKVPADLRYEEEVLGCLRVAPQAPAPSATAAYEIQRLAQPIARRFPTRGLVLRFAEERERLALASLAQALRHVLPIHLGVEDDALEVVPIVGERMPLAQGSTVAGPVWGLALVDLYPGGIGLVDAIADDDSLLLSLLEAAASWLSSCPCQNDTGCPACLQSPAAKAANSDHPPQRAAALDLLQQVL
jgi:Domain of unknown function (DUF1998)